MEHRDRATGWQHAKLSGHKNEDLVNILLDTNPEYANDFLCRLGLQGEAIKETATDLKDKATKTAKQVADSVKSKVKEVRK